MSTEESKNYLFMEIIFMLCFEKAKIRFSENLPKTRTPDVQENVFRITKYVAYFLPKLGQNLKLNPPKLIWF